jgi:UDP-2-acetamido-3-amino-2,3-dideoxy-glucuronate N-acetyltransferase
MDELRSTLVRRGATRGANCTIVCGITIGQYAFAGAGAVVTKDVPDFALVTGNPGHIAGWMCVCANRIDFTDDHEIGRCQECRRTYRKTGTEVILHDKDTFARSESSVLDYPV